jgi:uncharacterized protein
MTLSRRARALGTPRRCSSRSSAVGIPLFYLDRLDSFAARAKLPLSFSEYARRHLYATAGGLYSERYLNGAAEVLGVERLLFGSDYPYRPGPDSGVAAYSHAPA